MKRKFKDLSPEERFAKCIFGYSHMFEESALSISPEMINAIIENRQLTDIQRDVVLSRFGLNGYELKNFREQSENHTLSKSRLNQIFDKALRRLRYPSKLLADFRKFLQKNDVDFTF